MLGVDLGDDHGDVLGPAVGGVVGHHGAFALGVALLQRLDLFLLHIHGGEDEVHLCGDGLHVLLGAEQHDILGFLRDGGGHGPAGGDGVLIALTRRAGAGGQNGKLEPGMVLQQGHEALTHHAGGADHANSVFFHSKFLL